jgi:chromosome segregation ATPase
VQTHPRGPEEIREEIEQTREELGETVEALAAKTDVKAQARSRIEELKRRARAVTANPAAMKKVGAVAVVVVLGVVIARR